MASAAKPKGIDEDTRKLLIRLARRPTTRIIGRPPEHPNRWQPWKVCNPEALDMPFNDTSAWHLIADRLEQGEPVETTPLNHPEGTTGYEMEFELRPGTTPLYIKLALAPNKVIGRSFHISDRPTRQNTTSQGNVHGQTQRPR